MEESEVHNADWARQFLKNKGGDANERPEGCREYTLSRMRAQAGESISSRFVVVRARWIQTPSESLGRISSASALASRSCLCRYLKNAPLLQPPALST